MGSLSRQGRRRIILQRPLVPALPRLHAPVGQVLRLDQGLQKLRSYFRVERPRRVAVQGVLRRAGRLGGAAVQGPSDEERSVKEVQGQGHSYTRDPRRQDGRRSSLIRKTGASPPLLLGALVPALPRLHS